MSDKNGPRQDALPVLPYAGPHAVLRRRSSASLAFPVSAYITGTAAYLVTILWLSPAPLDPLWCVGVVFVPLIVVILGSVILAVALTLTRLFRREGASEPTARAYGWTGVAYAFSVAAGWWMLHATGLAPVGTFFENELHWFPIATLPAVAPLWLLRFGPRALVDG